MTSTTYLNALIHKIAERSRERNIDITKRFDRPTNIKEATVILQWLRSIPVAPKLPEPVMDTKSINPPRPTPPQAVDLRTYRQEPGKQAKAIRYALRDKDGTVRFYRVKPGNKPGFFFVDAQASDDLHPIKNVGHKQNILDAIAADPEAALALYGQEIGRCGHCGRTLTSEYRKLGIGPICINK